MPRDFADVQRELDETLRKIWRAKDREAALKLVDEMLRLKKEADSLKTPKVSQKRELP
jgi:hypothetical protein